MSHRLAGSLIAVAVLTLMGCGSSPHSPEEKYYLVATNIKIPYWQKAGAGLLKAAAGMQIKAEMVGPETYDPKAQQEEFRRIVGEKVKPAGILISPGDPALLKGDIDAAIAQGIPVITIDSDAAESKRLLFIGTDNYLSLIHI